MSNNEGKDWARIGEIVRAIIGAVFLAIVLYLSLYTGPVQDPIRDGVGIADFLRFLGITK